MFVLQSSDPSGWEDDVLMNHFPLLTDIWDQRFVDRDETCSQLPVQDFTALLKGAAHCLVHPLRAPLPGAPDGS